MSILSATFTKRSTPSVQMPRLTTAPTTVTLVRTLEKHSVCQTGSES